MREHARELKRAGTADGLSEVLAKIAEMPAADRAKAERLRAIVKAEEATIAALVEKAVSWAPTLPASPPARPSHRVPRGVALDAR